MVFLLALSYMFRPLLSHHQAILEVRFLSTLLLYTTQQKMVYTNVKIVNSYLRLDSRLDIRTFEDRGGKMKRKQEDIRY
jgi:hypothetical protein